MEDTPTTTEAPAAEQSTISRNDIIGSRFLSSTAISNLFTMGCAAAIDPRQAIPGKPTMPGPDVRLVRDRLIFEEVLELVVALGGTIHTKDTSAGIVKGNVEFVDHGNPNLDAAIDACCDIIYVAVGTLLAMGVPDIPHINLVNLRNNQKFPDMMAVVDANGKFQKPEGWVAPNHEELIAEMQQQCPLDIARFQAGLLERHRNRREALKRTETATTNTPQNPVG